MSERLAAHLPSPRSTQRHLAIAVGAAVGRGSTKLSAHDSALRVLGIADRNLLTLSSVIPTGSSVEYREAPLLAPGAWGDRLYVVMSEIRTSTRHKEVHAGLAWAQDVATGRGIFVEHAGHGEQQVRLDLDRTLRDMVDHRQETRLRPMGTVVTGTTCADEPVCAAAVAVFSAEPWRDEDSLHLPDVEDGA